jgi:hypothetical protein
MTLQTTGWWQSGHAIDCAEMTDSADRVQELDVEMA